MAQDYSGTHLGTTWLLNSSKPALSVLVNWSKDGSTWTEEGARLLALELRHALYSGQHGLPMLGQTPPSSAVLTLDNTDRRYSPDNSSSPLHAHISGGIYRVPVRISGGYYNGATPETLRQFTGEIEVSIEQERLAGRAARMECVDAAGAILQYKHSTALLVDQRADQLISAYLTSAGVTPGSALDVGLSVIPYAWLDDENVWEECQHVAASDGGWFYFDKSGAPRFERMSHWMEAAAHTSVQAVLERGEAFWLSDQTTWQNYYTGVIAEYAPRYGGAEDVLYQALETIEIAPGQTVTQIARLRNACSAFIQPVANTDYMAVDGGMNDRSANLTVTLTEAKRYAQRLEVVFTNNHATFSVFVMGFKIRGYPVLGEQAQEVTAGAVTGANSKVFPLRGNPYLQTSIQAERLANILNDRLSVARRLIQWRGVCCPWLELGDRVQVYLAGAPGDVSPVTQTCYVLSLAQTYNAGGLYQQELLLLPVTNVFGASAYFQLGASSYSETTTTPIFY